MKINQNWQLKFDGKPSMETKIPHVQAQSFDEFVKKSTMNIKNVEVTTLIKELELQGQRLARTRSIRELGRFKSLVRKLINNSLNKGTKLRYSSSFTAEGYENVLQVVERIDEELLLLTEALLDENKSQLDLLQYIGEIKGLIINLYT